MNPIRPLTLSNDVRVHCNAQKNNIPTLSYKLQPQIIQKQSKYQSDNIIQLYKAKNTTYDDRENGREITWNNYDERANFWETVDTGFKEAKSHLNNTMEAWKQEGNPAAPLAQYARWY